MVIVVVGSGVVRRRRRGCVYGRGCGGDCCGRGCRRRRGRGRSWSLSLSLLSSSFVVVNRPCSFCLFFSLSGIVGDLVFFQPGYQTFWFFVRLSETPGR